MNTLILLLLYWFATTVFAFGYDTVDKQTDGIEVRDILYNVFAGWFTVPFFVGAVMAKYLKTWHDNENMYDHTLNPKIFNTHNKRSIVISDCMAQEGERAYTITNSSDTDVLISIEGTTQEVKAHDELDIEFH
jgi:hypothetical protein